MPPSSAAGTPLPGHASAATEIDAPTISRATSRTGSDRGRGWRISRTSDEVFAHVETVTMRIGANFVPIKHEGTIYVRPPLS